MKKLFTLFLLLSCAVLNTYAQKYLPATLHFTDGRTAQMLVKATPPAGNQVFAKADERAKKEKIPSEQLSQIIFDVEESDPVVYEQHPLNLAGRIKDKQWMQVLVNGPVTLYGQSGSMGMMRGGMPHTVTDITFYARRKTEEHASFLGVHITSGAMPIGYNLQFRKFASEYFSDNPELVARIENKEFKVSEAIQLVQEYNKRAL